MKIYTSFGIASALVVFSSACATLPPQELADARSTYARASTGPASELNPAGLHKAKVSLDQAEQAFGANPDAQNTKDLAYVADRKSQMAEVRAMEIKAEKDKKIAEEAYLAQQAQLHSETKAELDTTKQQLAKGNLQHVNDAIKLNDERAARKNAEDKSVTAEQKVAASEAKNKELEIALVKLAAFKEESRGLVLTLSGGVLFVSNSANLLPSAQTKLNEIAEALVSGSQRQVLVEGHTDSQGKDSSNLDLSQRRADAVRNYIVSRGLPAEQIRSSGLGETRPVASNGSAEGRANNRRVELVILPM